MDYPWVRVSPVFLAASFARMVLEASNKLDAEAV